MAHTEETKQKIRAAWVERRKTFIPPMKGKRMNDESRRKMSESASKRASNRTGKLHTLESRAKMSAVRRQRAKRGPDNPAYKDGRVAERRGERFSAAYLRWRFDVFMRDAFTCQKCGDARGGNLVAHHVKPFADYPELRFDVTNGLTLCTDCHKAVHREDSHG